MLHVWIDLHGPVDYWNLSTLSRSMTNLICRHNDTNSHTFKIISTFENLLIGMIEWLYIFLLNEWMSRKQVSSRLPSSEFYERYLILESMGFTFSSYWRSIVILIFNTSSTTFTQLCVIPLAYSFQKLVLIFSISLQPLFN